MAEGLQVFDPSGNVIFDAATTSTDRILGIASTGTTDGNFSDSKFSEGTPWYVVMPKNGFGLATGYPRAVATITAPTLGNSWTLSWAFAVSGHAENTDCYIIYGVFS